MKKQHLTSVLVLGISALLVHEARGQVFRIDMDATTPAIDAVISPLLGSTISVGLYLDLTGGGVGYPPGMSVYGVSLVFDNTELTLTPPPPAATQSIPTLLPFGFGTLGVPMELEVDLAAAAGGTLGSVKSFAGFTFAAGPVGGLHLLGTVNFKVDSISGDGLLDVTPGFFNAGIDGLFDNASGLIAMGPANFVGGSVIPPLPPRLTITRLGANVFISWPSPSTGFNLQVCTNLVAGNWTYYAGPPNIQDNGVIKSLTLPPTATPHYYRLKNP